MANIKLHELIDGYENSDGEEFVGQRFFRREITGAATISAKRKKRSKIRQALSSLIELICYANIKTYGFLFLTFGLLTIIFYFAKDFLLGYGIPVTDSISLIAGIISALLSVPMLILDGPICQVLQEYLITDIIFFDFLCIKRMPPAKEYEPNAVSAVILGVIFGIVGLFVPTITVVAVVFFVVYAFLSIESPEFSLFSTIMILPYLSMDKPEGYSILVTLVIITAISFIRKLAFGKRVLNLEQYDILIGFMLLTVLVSGFALSGIASSTWSIKYISLSLVYILAGNIITNRRLADCAVNATIFAAVIPALTSLATFIRLLATTPIDGIYYNGISSVYSTREVAAAHFAVSVAMAVAMSIQTKGNIRAGYIALGAFIFLGLLLTFEPFAYIAVVLGIVAYLAIRKGRAFVLLLLPLAAIPYAIVSLVPGDLLNTVIGPGTDGLMPGNIIELWGEALKIFGNHPILGIGIGSEAFGTAISGSGFGVTNSHNIFLEIATEAGVFALIAFILIIWVRVRHRVNYHKYLVKSDVNVISSSASCAVFVLITIGATVYIWQDMSLYYIFWCVFGIGSATLRIAKQESDDRELYSKMMVNFHESSNNEFASVDIPLVKENKR
jgi:O-antigen ligase